MQRLIDPLIFLHMDKIHRRSNTPLIVTTVHVRFGKTYSSWRNVWAKTGHFEGMSLQNQLETWHDAWLDTLSTDTTNCQNWTEFGPEPFDVTCVVLLFLSRSPSGAKERPCRFDCLWTRNISQLGPWESQSVFGFVNGLTFSCGQRIHLAPRDFVDPSFMFKLRATDRGLSNCLLFGIHHFY